jgi:L-rhamnose-H+ transport protein
MLSGVLMLLAASLCQGSFVLPMTLVRKWRWEHTWLAFSLLGMFVFNWAFGFAGIPHMAGALRDCPSRDLLILAAFGAGWGVGAILFGLGMARLGMSLGYPIIMGLISALGALIPLAVFFPAQLFAPKGLVVMGGTVLALAGIVLCSTGAARKEPAVDPKPVGTRGSLAASLLIAVSAGILSCLPNVGMAFGETLTQTAIRNGASPAGAANAVWVLFFTAGGVVNCAYCAWLILMRRGEKAYRGPETRRNVALAALMALLWIGSFYLYGIGSRSVGRWGLVVAWPVFISLSIGTGVLWGLWRGEWNGAPPASRCLRNWGLATLFVAVVIIGLSQAV